jgi:acetoin utilization deacetylase AcuC-like enzyme
MYIYTHPACLLHNPGAAHPEHPQRLQTVIDALRAAFGEQLQWQLAPLASDEQLLRAHSARLVADIRAGATGTQLRRLDADTLMSPGSLEAGLRASGAICAAIDAVISGTTRRAFCAVRPPGHHSSADRAAGFCLFNQIAVGARHARAVHGLQRVAIVDFDVHHGNGTQAIFAADAGVLFVSSQQSPLYPGSGFADETGIGNLVNGVLAPGAGSAEFRALWRTRLLPEIDRYAPELLLVSAGFDAHRLDPLADLNLAADDYRWITQELVALAERHAGGRLVSTLEGGYSLTALRESSVAHVDALLQASGR